jgi:hypothetical protein
MQLFYINVPLYLHPYAQNKFITERRFEFVWDLMGNGQTDMQLRYC